MPPPPPVYSDSLVALLLAGVCVLLSCLVVYFLLLIRKYFLALRESETKRKQSEDFLKTITESIPYPFVIMDREYQITMANRSAREIYGFDPSRQQCRCYEVLKKEHAPCREGLCSMVHTLQLDKPMLGYFRHKDKMNRDKVVEVASAPVEGQDGEKLVLEFFIDRTAQHEVQRQLNIRNRLLGALAESTRLILSCSEGLKEGIDRALQNIVKASGADQAQLYALSTEGEDTGFELLSAWSAQKQGAVALEAALIPPGSPEVLPRSGNMRFYEYFADDISLSEDFRNFLQGCGAQSSLCVWVYCRNQLWGLLKLDNCLKRRKWAVFEKSVMKTIADQLGLTVSIFLSEQELLDNREQLKTRMRELEEANREASLSRQAAEMMAQEMRRTLEVSEQLRNDTDIARAEAEELADKAESANLAKSEFLANMSHEIRTPLNSVIGMADLLLTTRMDQEQKSYVESVRRSGDALLNLINDVLDFSKIEAGQMRLSSEPMNLLEVLEQSTQMLAGLAAGKSVELLSSYPAVAPVHVVGDELRVRQILINLLGNAIKFTHDGHVKVSCRLLESGKEKVWMRISVRDTGIGMSSETLKVIFNKFTQADTSITRRYGGTGLGLSISLRLAQLMGGKLVAESELDKGSTFHLDLPFGQVPQEQPDVVSLSDLEVLLCGGSAVCRDSAVDLLQDYGARCYQASGAAEVFATLAEHENIGLLIVDHSLSDLPADEFLQQLRGHGYTQKVVILEEPGQKLNPDYGHQSLVVFKPVRRDGFVSMCRKIADGCGLDQLQEHLQSAGPGRYQGRVLVVEDNPANQKLAMALLKKFGCEYALAENGQQAVEMHAQSDYDMIMMDLHMPVMDGLQATTILRSEEVGCVLPIVAMTASALSEDRERCLDAGVDEYLVKPITLKSMEAVLAKFLPKTQGGVEVSAFEGGDLPGDSSESENGDVPVVFNYETAYNATGGDEEILRDAMEIFCESSLDQLAKLCEAIHNDDIDTATMMAHTIKGGAATFGAEIVSALALEAEMACRNGDRLLAGGVLPKLEAALKEYIGEIQGGFLSNGAAAKKGRA